MRILIVEDMQDARELLRIFLELDDHMVLEAANGQEAVELAQDWKPELIFMDLRMPVMDGYEATRRIRKSHTGAGVPIIAISADYNDDTSARALQAGCDFCTAKPYSISQLRDLLRCFSRAAESAVYRDACPAN